MRRLHENSSWPCVRQLVELLAPAAVSVERQQRLRRSAASTVGADPLSAWEARKNFRMNVAGMQAGLELMRRHAASMGLNYTAVVRIRADVGGKTVAEKRGWSQQFLSEVGWYHVQRRAAAWVSGKLPLALSQELVTCGNPRVTRMDFCWWSVPEAPLTRTAATLQEGLERNSFGQSCRDYVNASGVPAFTESVLFCALKELSGVVVPSLLWDSLPDGGVGFGCQRKRDDGTRFSWHYVVSHANPWAPDRCVATLLIRRLMNAAEAWRGL